MFKPHIQDVTATAIIKGLAVTKYNHGTARWEAVFLRNCGHHPKLTIREVDRRSGRILSIVKTYKIEEGDGISITVASSAANIPWRYVTDGPFNGSPSHDPQDLRWMLDIQALHGGEVERTGNIETNLLSITDGCFYTSVRAKTQHRKRWINRDGTASTPQKMKLTGSMVGADFKGSEVVVDVEGATGFPLPLRHNSNSRYEIIFNNTCVEADQPPPTETDFHYYYRLFDASKGRADILPPEDSENTGIGGGGSVSDSEDGAFNPEGGENPDPEPEPKEPACHVIDDGDTGNSGS